ncbi:MAG: AMP-binding protein [Erysipelotrichaceae bacterium]|nr:AMP-binding protein [Erysipelotrichaceae bacterium]
MNNKIKYTNLDMRAMYVEAIERGQNKSFALFQRIDGSVEEYTYKDIQLETSYLLEKLEKSGLKKGDRIAVVSSLRPWWFALTYACLINGYIMTCIDPGVPAIQLQKLMLEAEVRAVFTTLKVIHLPKELEEHIPVFSIESGFPLMSKCRKVDYLLGEAKKLPEDTFFILFSSGTTGENRKAVLLRHTSITTAIEYGMANDSGVYKHKPAYVPNKCDLMLFPPYHIAGLLMATYDFYNNSKIVMLERLTPNALMSVFENIKPDCISTVPSMLTSLYKKILAGYSNRPLFKLTINNLLGLSGMLRRTLGIKAGRFFLKPINKKAFGGNMKSFMIGASPFDETANKFFLDMGIDVMMAYGLTELGAPLATTGQGYYPGTTGRVVRHTEDIDIRIVNKDESGKGEVEVKSPYRMISYINYKDNEGCYTNDGYFKTGDLGYFNKKKCLIICGRIKESIVLRNGEKLLPEEIESKYQEVDCVKDLVAFKVPGEGGCDDFSIAIINDKSKGIPDEAVKLRVFERSAKLPQMYRPKNVYVVKEFPYSSSHKIQRFRLTDMVIKGEDTPVTDALMIPIDEDATTAALRKILVEVGGSQWKSEKLTQGLLLNLDSLATVNLYVAIQDKWQIDLFQTSNQPETFGELLDVVKNYDVIEKNNKKSMDLSQYPLPSSKFNKLACKQIERLIKTAWRVKATGVENFPTNTNYIICSNHQTDIDPAFISSIMPEEVVNNTCFVGKAELVQDKLFKQLVISHNFIPIDRTGNSIQTLDRCQELLMQGMNILIFPEGTSAQNHQQLFPLKEGYARLAISTNRPVVPLHIKGVAHTDKEMKNFQLPSLKGKIQIVVGKPIYPDGKTSQELNELLIKAIQEL